MFREMCLVEILKPIPMLGLAAGEFGSVTRVHSCGSRFDVEFKSSEGALIGIATVHIRDLRALAAD